MATPGAGMVCGSYCGECRFYQTKCPGCAVVKGQPFWTKQYGLSACRLWDCCVGEHHLEHCGECSQLPCELFLSVSDPSYSPEEARANMEKRVQSLKARKAAGTPAWLTAQAAHKE